MAEQVEQEQRGSEDFVEIDVSRSSVNGRYSWGVKIRYHLIPGREASQTDSIRDIVAGIEMDLRTTYGSEGQAFKEGK